jgi:hypothetical protein
MKFIITLLFVLTALSSGCTTTRVLDPRPVASSAEEISPGDTVRVYLEDGRDLELTVVSWTDEQLVGLDESKTSQTIDRHDIVRLETQAIDGGKTALAAVGIAGLSLLVYALTHLDEAAAAALCC